MSKCKVVKLSETDGRRVSLGTVDRHDPKSFYLTIVSWITPNHEMKPSEITRQLEGKFKKALHRNRLTNTAFIDLDLRESGLRVDKKSFMSCEITFLNNELGFNGNTMRELLDSFIDELDNIVMYGDDNFSFSARK